MYPIFSLYKYFSVKPSLNVHWKHRTTHTLYYYTCEDIDLLLVLVGSDQRVCLTRTETFLLSYLCGVPTRIGKQAHTHPLSLSLCHAYTCIYTHTHKIFLLVLTMCVLLCTLQRCVIPVAVLLPPLKCFISPDTPPPPP